ncbi:MAG: serine hydrolase [Flavobacteriaceae bacterium]|nr:serine hydrolase [Flavobacteriaceae bacterium]
MKIFNYILVLLVCNILNGQSLNSLTLEMNGFDYERLSRLSNKLDEFSKEGILPGSVVLISKNDEIIYHEAFGFSDIDNQIPMKTNSIFRIASQTKFITATAIMMLQERGELVITENVSKYIPEFKETFVAKKSDDGYSIEPADREITIKDLLTHTSGVGYGFGIASKVWEEAGIQGFYLIDRNESIVETVKKIAKLPHEAHPGDEYVYGYSSDILGAIVEVVSGNSLDTFLKENLFDPLEMTDTSFYLPDSKKNRLTTVYIYSEDNGLKRAPYKGTFDSQGSHYIDGPKKSFSGGAGLLSTSSDYYNFLLMILNEGKYENLQILSRKSIEIMTKDNLTEGIFPYAGMGHGLGVQVVNNRAKLSVLGSNGELIGGGAYRTEYWIDSQEDLIGIILVQIREPQYLLRFHDTIKTLIYQALK